MRHRQTASPTGHNQTHFRGRRSEPAAGAAMNAWKRGAGAGLEVVEEMP